MKLFVCLYATPIVGMEELRVRLINKFVYYLKIENKVEKKDFSHVHFIFVNLTLCLIIVYL